MIKTNVLRIGDPQILAYNGVYYMYGTNSSKGFRAYTSTDLIHWEEKGFCFEAPEDYWGYKSFWAPEVTYYKGKFYMHFSARQKSNNSLRCAVAVADNPLGPFVDPIGKPLFDLGYAAIDGHVFIDGDGKIYFYYSKDCCENRLPDGTRASQLYCVRMNEDLTSVYGEHVLVSTPTEPWEKLSRDPLWNEGPCMLKYGGRYFLSYSINFFASDHYGIAVSVADCPMGPFVKMEDNPRLSKAQGIRGPGHNAYFTGFDGKLYSVLHIRDVMPDGKVDRMACVTEVKLDENGVHFND